MKKKNKNSEIIETSAMIEENAAKKENKFKVVLSKITSFFKKFKSKKIRNQALFRRGSYSLIITAFVLVALIAFNWLVSSLGDRFNLEFDMTIEKKHSISPENKEYVEKLDADVKITIVGTESEFLQSMVNYAYRSQIAVTTDEYFLQTVTLIEKYTDYNDRITLKYIDPQTSEFLEITTKYEDYPLGYGSIIVTSEARGSERVRVLNFEDIYLVSSGSSYQTLSGNRIESALTSAIAYVTSADDKKVAVLAGHGDDFNANAYKELLAMNNYEVVTVTDKIITPESIPNDCDAIIISAPNKDFIDSEIDVISAFLENDGKKGKGLIFFADAACPPIPNFYTFLKQWGIEVGEGVLFETNKANQVISDSPSTMGLYPVSLEEGDDLLQDVNFAITNYLVPMKVCEDSSLQRTATALMQTLDSVVVAPIGSSATWSDPDAKQQQFDCAIQSVETDFDKDNNTLTSYVMAFASVEFVQSDWALDPRTGNMQLVINCTNRAVHVGDTDMTFTLKTIDQQDFRAEKTEEDNDRIENIFMFIVPLGMIAFGIIVFIRRRNAR